MSPLRAPIVTRRFWDSLEDETSECQPRQKCQMIMVYKHMVIINQSSIHFPSNISVFDVTYLWSVWSVWSVLCAFVLCVHVWVCLRNWSCHQVKPLSWKISYNYIITRFCLTSPDHKLIMIERNRSGAEWSASYQPSHWLVSHPALEAVLLSSINLGVRLLIGKGRQQWHATLEALHGHDHVETLLDWNCKEWQDPMVDSWYQPELGTSYRI